MKCYRRLNRKTRNAHVATVFGTIELQHYGYRYWHRDVPEKRIFPLDIQLGLVVGVTPALAEAAARCGGDGRRASRRPGPLETATSGVLWRQNAYR